MERDYFLELASKFNVNNYPFRVLSRGFLVVIRMSRIEGTL